MHTEYIEDIYIILGGDTQQILDNLWMEDNLMKRRQRLRSQSVLCSEVLPYICLIHV